MKDAFCFNQEEVTHQQKPSQPLPTWDSPCGDWQSRRSTNWFETSPSTTGHRFRVADSRQVALRCLAVTTSTITTRFRLQDPPFWKNKNKQRATHRSTHRHTQKSWTTTTGMSSSRAAQFRTRHGRVVCRGRRASKRNLTPTRESRMFYKKASHHPHKGSRTCPWRMTYKWAESEDVELKQEILTEKYQANLQKFENRTLQNGARTEEAKSSTSGRGELSKY